MPYHEPIADNGDHPSSALHSHKKPWMPVRTHRGMPKARAEACQLINRFLESRGANTRSNYDLSLRVFAHFLGVETAEEAVEQLLSSPTSGVVNMLVTDYRSWLIDREAAPASINRHLAVLRSLTKWGRLFGLTELYIEVMDVRGRSIRDVSGPSTEDIAKLFQVIDDRTGRWFKGGRRDPHKERDKALIMLVYCDGLRRFEALELNLCHLDLPRRGVLIKGKGEGARIRRTIPESTRNMLAAWLKVRDDHIGSNPDGPVFVNLYPGYRGDRLTGHAFGVLLQRLSVLADIPTIRPHGLRHSAITRVLDLNGGDIRKAQRFSRLKNLNHLLIYDDTRLDHAGEMADLLAEDLKTLSD